MPKGLRASTKTFEGHPCRCGETLRYVAVPQFCVACRRRYNAARPPAPPKPQFKTPPTLDDALRAALFLPEGPT